MRVVFDCNVLISASLKKNSSSAIALRQVIQQGTVIYSVPTLKELSSKILNQKFDKYVSVKQRIEFLIEFKQVCESVEIFYEVNICRDPKDNMYLELALSGKADYIVSGDKDLLVLHPFENVSILSVSDFLSKI